MDKHSLSRVGFEKLCYKGHALVHLGEGGREGRREGGKDWWVSFCSE